MPDIVINRPIANGCASRFMQIRSRGRLHLGDNLFALFDCAVRNVHLCIRTAILRKQKRQPILDATILLTLFDFSLIR